MDRVKPVKIVLAEDEPLIAMAYKEGLGYHGFDVVVARDGKEALIAIEKERPDILLLDVIMPNMNGFEVLETVRNDPTQKELLVIMLTNLGQPSDADRVCKLGAKGYLIKSNLSLRELVRHVNEALGTATA